MDPAGELTSARIIVPLDGSRAAEVVLPHAVTLARATSATLCLVMVVEPHSTLWSDYQTTQPGEPDYIHQLREAELAEARDYLASVAHRIGGEGKEPEYEVLHGDIALTLVQYAQRDPRIKMIAMTTYGRRGAGQWPLGSVTEKVLCAATRPLLVVRPDEQSCAPSLPSYRPYHHILVPLDGSVLAEQALDQACAIALGTGATLLLLSAVTAPDDIGRLPTGVRIPVTLSAWQAEVDCIASYLRRTALELHDRSPFLRLITQIVADHPDTAILDMSERMDCDLIVMSTHGKNAGGADRRTWLGSIALKVVQSASSPVLLVRSKEVADLKQWTESEDLQNHLDTCAQTAYSDV